ncbi:PIM1 kinase, partial [Scytalopus superciliaris]|nr:PIM1 kinase [Scytalopus superciliaris]
PLEFVLLLGVPSHDFNIVVQLLDWFKLSNNFVLGMGCLQCSQDLYEILEEQGFLMVWGLLCQVLEAMWHQRNRGVLHCDTKARNSILDPATSEMKLIDFGCGTFLKGMLYTHFSGMQVYSPLEWILLHCYHGHPVVIWSLGILLYVMVCRDLPHNNNEDIIQGQLFFWPRVS